MSRGKGTPHPGEWIRHQTVTQPRAAADRTLWLGADCSNGVEQFALFALAGASRARARFKSIAAGTLAFYFVQPDGVTRYAAGNPSTVAVTANTETLIDTNNAYGESWCIVAFTPSASQVASITLFDFMAL